jgi:hypothetical protein
MEMKLQINAPGLDAQGASPGESAFYRGMGSARMPLVHVNYFGAEFNDAMEPCMPAYVSGEPQGNDRA